jgi:putative MATE family efflux protein
MTAGTIEEPGVATSGAGRSIARKVAVLAAPVVVEQLLLYLVGFSDTLLTGRFLGVDELAAVTVSSYLLWFLGSLLMIASAGGTALVARLVGAGDWPGASKMALQALVLALIVGSAMMIGGIMGADALVRLMGLSGAAARGSALYLRIILASIPLLACEVVGIACLRGAGDTRTGMWVMGLVNLINVVLSWSLVRGWGPLPAIGLAGVALGTAVAESVGSLVVLGLLAAGRSGLRLRPSGMVPDPAALRRLLRISVPAAGEAGTNSLCQLWFLSLINRLGPTATAAHGVAIRCEAIAFLTVTAFSVAASTLTGQYLGARRPDLAAKAARISWGLGTLVLSGLGLVLALRAEALFGLFLGGTEAEIVALGAPLLRVVAFAMPFLATISVLTGALRGAGDTRWPWVFVLIGYLGVRMPLTYLLTTAEADGGWGLGLLGAWLAMLADLIARAALVAGRFWQGGWKRVRV